MACRSSVPRDLSRAPRSYIFRLNVALHAAFAEVNGDYSVAYRWDRSARRAAVIERQHQKYGRLNGNGPTFE